MNIHQMQLRYQPPADRLLWQLRTTGGDLYAVWLTRRMVRLLWPPLNKLVTHAGILQTMPHASVLPEAQAMLAQAVRDRPLPGASFAEPFDSRPTAQPLGAEPLLPEAIDLGPGDKGQGLKLQLREESGRRLAMQLSADLATALLRLMEQALAAADWGLVIAPATPDGAAPSPSALN
ncbi:MAG: hypothetical protein QE285_07440 [Aquabacterium sp.]|nr:hypothetical protein [Aquabacterium sp.]